MNDVSIITEQLPDTIEDLSRFVLINEERVQAMKAQIRAIKKVSLAKEVYEQKLAEAQEIGQITVEAAQKMGELLLQIQKSSGGDRKTGNFKIREGTNFEKSKSEITSEMGMTKDQVSQYQQMAQNPDAVQAAIQKAIENGDVVSRSQVMKEIKAAKEQAKKDVEELYESRLAELESQKTADRVTVIEKEVAPPDYEELKKENEALKRDNRRQTDDYQRLSKSKEESDRKVEELQSIIGEDKRIGQAEASVMSFTNATNDYIRHYGGHVWVFSEFEYLREETKADFIKSLKALDSFAMKLMENLEGSLNGK